MAITSIQDYIVVLENIVDSNLCEALLNEYIETEEWRDASIGNNVVDKSKRNLKNIGLSLPSTIAKNKNSREKLDHQLFISASKALSLYQERFPLAKIERDSGYDLLRYKTGEFYTQHVDSFATEPRAVSCSFALNDDYEGGEFGFFDRELVVKAPKGGAVLFPSNFMYPHEIMPVTKGTRYSIITWFI